MFYDDEVEMVIVRTTEGDLGILKNHIPTVAPLEIGKVRIKEDGVFKEAAIAGGFVKIEGESSTIITDAAEWPNEINVERAREAKERAEKRLQSGREGIDTVRAEIALKKAINRINLVENNKR